MRAQSRFSLTSPGLHFQGYEGSEYEETTEDVVLEREQGQAHVAEDDVLSQEVHKFKQLETKQRPKSSVTTGV